MILLLGQADDVEHARRLVKRYQDPDAVEQASWRLANGGIAS